MRDFVAWREAVATEVVEDNEDDDDDDDVEGNMRLSSVFLFLLTVSVIWNLKIELKLNKVDLLVKKKCKNRKNKIKIY